MESLHPDQCYAAIKSHDARFDGLFFVAISTTGIYCRPVCRARTPGRDRCSFFANAARAEAAGYRPCLRCRPELAPGAAPLDTARRIADLAVARIEAGALNDAGVDSLAAEFGISARQLRRVIEREYGVTPLALAQTHRLLLAKQLLTDTGLRIADIAFASGFSSVRRCNHLFRTRYKLNPTAMRRRRQPGDDVITLKLGYRPPFAWPALAGFLCSRGANGVERFDGKCYQRTLRIANCQGWITAQPEPRGNLLRIAVAPDLVPVLPQVRARLRHLFDLDAQPALIDAHLAADPRLAPLITETRGLRVPGAVDGFELALRAVLGQQITVKAATTIFGRFVQYFGQTIATPFTGLDHLSPRAEDIAAASLQQIIDQGVTRRRAETIRCLALAIAEDRLTLRPNTRPLETLAVLGDIRGIGPWTMQYISMRALADPDALPASDLGLLKTLGLRRAAELSATATQWRPWRAYAAMHLWHSLSAGG